MATHSSILAWKFLQRILVVLGFTKGRTWLNTSLSPVKHILSELSTMTHPSWVALHGMAHSFTELDKTVVHVIRLFSFCDGGFQSVFPLMEKDNRLTKAS